MVMNKALGIEKLVMVCKKFGIDPQVVDLEAHYDDKLTYRENYEAIYEYISPLIKGDKKDEIIKKKDVEKYEVAIAKKEEEHAQQVQEGSIEAIKKESIKELSPYYQSYNSHIEHFVRNKRVNGFIAVGDGGTGKSYNLMLKLQEMKRDLTTQKGHITALAFYKFLHENREGKDIVIDDILKLIEDKDIVALLLSAVDYESRTVEWNSMSPLTTDVPSKFEFNSKIYILANQFDDDNNNFLRALKDRCIFYQLKFTKNQKIKMLYILANKRGYPVEVVDYIKELSESCVIKNLSLRLLDKIYPYHTPKGNWKGLVKEILETDEVLDVVYEVSKSHATRHEQVQEFTKRTGLSRATFYRLVKKI